MSDIAASLTDEGFESQDRVMLDGRKRKSDDACRQDL
jgi:hypothetical protein